MANPWIISPGWNGLYPTPSSLPFVVEVHHHSKTKTAKTKFDSGVKLLRTRGNPEWKKTKIDNYIYKTK